MRTHGHTHECWVCRSRWIHMEICDAHDLHPCPRDERDPEAILPPWWVRHRIERDTRDLHV